MGNEQRLVDRQKAFAVRKIRNWRFSRSFKEKDKKIPKNELAVLAKKYSGEDNGLIAEKSRRDQVLVHSMRERAFQLTARRVSQENSSGKTPGPTTSIFKLVGANSGRDFTEIKSDLMGVKGIGWEGDGFSEREIESTRRG